MISVSQIAQKYWPAVNPARLAQLMPTDGRPGVPSGFEIEIHPGCRQPVSPGKRSILPSVDDVLPPEIAMGRPDALETLTEVVHAAVPGLVQRFGCRCQTFSRSAHHDDGS